MMSDPAAALEKLSQIPGLPADTLAFGQHYFALPRIKAVPTLEQFLDAPPFALMPRVVITDKLPNYGAALREVLPSAEHRRHKELNNRAENSHQPTRERERRMRRFKDPGHAQRFLAAYGPIAAHFRPRRHRLSAAAYRAVRRERFTAWREVAGLPAVA